jgi:Zn-dependent membrane protease YugP
MDDYYFISYGLVIIGFLITLAAEINVKSTFKRYSKVMNSRGLTGADAASMILSNAGITDVQIAPVGGSLTDHYSPGEKVLRLSQTVFGSTSVAAVGIAAHECGHAIQHKEGYSPLRLRTASGILANVGSWFSWPLIVIGLGFGFLGLAQAGVILFSFVVLFQLVTLPVEFDASRRAVLIMETSGLLSTEELSASKKVLTAAALTYLAALLSTILQLLRLIMIVGGGRRRD